MSAALLAACTPIAVEMGQDISPDETASPPLEDTGPTDGGTAGQDTDTGGPPDTDSQPGETGETGDLWAYGVIVGPDGGAYG